MNDEAEELTPQQQADELRTYRPKVWRSLRSGDYLIGGRLEDYAAQKFESEHAEAAKIICKKHTALKAEPLPAAKAAESSDFMSKSKQFPAVLGGRELAIKGIEAKLSRLNAGVPAALRFTSYDKKSGAVVTASATAVLPTKPAQELNAAQRSTARATELGYVRGSEFAAKLGLRWSSFSEGVRSKLLPSPVLTRDGCSFFDAQDVERAVARRKA